MSNLLLVLDAEGVSFAPQNAGDGAEPDFPLGWEDFIVARQRFLDQLSRPSADSPGASGLTAAPRGG